jgi:hypothetical protein
MLEIIKETTVWSGDYQNCNHIYLLDSSKIIAYVKSGDSSVQVLRTPLRIDKRYRTFIKANHDGLAKLIKSQPKDPNTKVFKVQSNTKEYFVKVTNNRYSCTCTGYNFRGKCKHIDAVAKKQQENQ